MLCSLQSGSNGVDSFRPLKSNILHKPFSHVLLIVIIGFLVYSSTFSVPFVLDDINNIVNNSLIRNPSNIPSMFTHFQGPPISARPFTAATFAANYWFGGLSPVGFHLFNLALHLMNGILFYFLMKITAKLLDHKEEQGSIFIALLSSLIFIAHPVQTESVTYIVTRSSLLAALFFLFGIILFVRAVTSKKTRALYTIALVFTSLLGMASREEFFLFPFMLILYDFFFLSKYNIKEVLRHYKVHVPVLLTLSYLIFIVLNYNYQKHAGFGVADFSPIEYLMTQFNVHWTYVRLLIFPVEQNLDYDYPIAKTLFEVPTIVSFVGYAGLWVAGGFLYKRKPIISFCILWFLITLAPSSSIIPITDVVFEHRLYMPSMGFSIVVTTSIFFFTARLRCKSHFKGRAAILLLAVIIVCFAWAAHARNCVWSDDLTLWEDVVRKSPDKARAHNEVGAAYLKRGLTNKAMEHFEIASKLYPDLFHSYNNLGVYYNDEGLYDRAIENFMIAVSLDPNESDIYYNLGIAYFNKGLFDEAIENYQTALRLVPDNADYHNNLGLAYAAKGFTKKAAEHYLSALKLQPDLAHVHFNLGALYLQSGDVRKARDEFQVTLKLDPGNPRARKLLDSMPRVERPQLSE